MEKLDTCIAYGISADRDPGVGIYLGDYADYKAFVQVAEKMQGEKGSFVQISERQPIYEERDVEDI